MAEQAQGEHSAVSVVNIGLPGQGEEQEDLDPLPAEAGTALAKAPRPAGCSPPNSPLPTPHLLSQPQVQARPPGEGRGKTKWLQRSSCFSL